MPSESIDTLTTLPRVLPLPSVSLPFCTYIYLPVCVSLFLSSRHPRGPRRPRPMYDWPGIDHRAAATSEIAFGGFQRNMTG